ncbi:hypothetical protein B0H14DRAFT_2623316 [Mycena olivaceomarginata]|nr:hypothetical protein B0H14DRAFT_2623316 [Mycena olivaceomarginata]
MAPLYFWREADPGKTTYIELKFSGRACSLCACRLLAAGTHCYHYTKQVILGQEATPARHGAFTKAGWAHAWVFFKYLLYLVLLDSNEMKWLKWKSVWCPSQLHEKNPAIASASTRLRTCKEMGKRGDKCERDNDCKSTWAIHWPTTSGSPTPSSARNARPSYIPDPNIVIVQEKETSEISGAAHLLSILGACVFEVFSVE